MRKLTFPPRSLSFHRWVRQEGLPNETVTALLQTQDGYLWVGTAGGSARFDGVEFEELILPLIYQTEPAA